MYESILDKINKGKLDNLDNSAKMMLCCEKGSGFCARRARTAARKDIDGC
jgi:hypothetical protein